MIVCKFVKKGASAYIPHLDVFRHFVMAARRNGLKLGYSEGFNPHPLIYMSQPLPLGTESECEYFAAVTDEDPIGFLNGVNDKLPRGIEVVKAGIVEKASVAADCVAAKWEISFPLDVKTVETIMKSETFSIEYEDKGKTLVKEVRNKIYSIEVGEGRTTAVLGYGNNNLRADRLIKYIGSLSGNDYGNAEVRKTAAYTLRDGKLVDLDTVYFV